MCLPPNLALPTRGATAPNLFKMAFKHQALNVSIFKEDLELFKLAGHSTLSFAKLEPSGIQVDHANLRCLDLFKF